MLGFIIGIVLVAGVIAVIVIAASRSGASVGSGGSGSFSRLIESLRETSEQSRSMRSISNEGRRPASARAASFDQRPTEPLNGVPKPLGKDGLRGLEASKAQSAARRSLRDAGGLGIQNRRF